MYLKTKNILLSVTAVLALTNATSQANTALPSTKSANEAASYEKVFSNLALQCIHQTYPNVVKHMMNDASDVKSPDKLYPAFYGCLDWHSSVHGHWLLVRMLNTAQDNVDRERIISQLALSFTKENIDGELTSLLRENNASFERPYGLAWFLQLTAELRTATFPEAAKWLEVLTPLETAIVERISTWLPKLAYPIRTGEHSQTAFAFGLMLDWARESKNEEFEELLTGRIKQYYSGDKQCPLAYEPSGQDFLSPCLAEADLMRRVMSQSEFAIWLTAFFPQLTGDTEHWLAPATVTDKSDGKLAHLDGLNISRAWMIEGIMRALPQDDKRQDILKASFEQHRSTGLHAVIGDMHYMGSHWLGSFASYLETQRGIK